MTKVSDEDLVLLRTSEDREACTGVTQDRIDAVLAELLALRRVADAAEAYIAADMDDYHTSSTTDLCAALTAAGR